MATQVEGCVPLIIRGQWVGTKLMQQLADVHVPSGGGQVEACSTSAVSDIWVKAAFQKPLGIGEVSIDASLKQGHVSLRRVIHKDVRHRLWWMGTPAMRGEGRGSRWGQWQPVKEHYYRSCLILRINFLTKQTIITKVSTMFYFPLKEFLFFISAGSKWQLNYCKTLNFVSQ